MKLLSKRRHWLRPLGWLSAFLAVAGTVLFWRLGTLAPAGMLETASCRAADLSTPSGIVYALARQLNIHDCDPAHALWMRLPSVLLAMLAGGLFIWAVKLWLGRQAALYGGLLFVTSAWFLHAGRFAGMQAALLLIVPLTIWLWRFAPRYQAHAWLGYVVAVSMALLISLPSGLWFALLIAGLRARPVIVALQRHKPWQIGLQYLVFFIGLAPLVYSFVVTDNRRELLSWLGFSQLMAIDPMAVLKQVTSVPAQLFVHGPDEVALWLPGLPILDILVAFMAVAGIVWMIMKLKGESRLLIIGLLILTLIFTGLGGYGAGQLSIIAPFLYFAAAAGIRLFLHKWRETFPRNPFARGLAYGLVSLAVSASVTYNIRAYFVAWPHNPAVLTSFRQGR